MIFKITQKTTTYGLNSIHHTAPYDWNELLKNIRLEFDVITLFPQNWHLPKH